MSVNGTTSCATCHRQEMAFTDGRAQALGAAGQSHPRSSMSLVNVAYNNAFNWSDPTVHSLEEQALKPMFSTNPVELGVVKADLLRLIRSDAIYGTLFPRRLPAKRMRLPSRMWRRRLLHLSGPSSPRGRRMTDSIFSAMRTLSGVRQARRVFVFLGLWRPLVFSVPRRFQFQ